MRPPRRWCAALAGLVVAGVGADALAQGAPPFAQDGARRPADDDAQQEQQPAAPVAPPRLLRFVEAEYPAEARARGVAANVLLELTIGADGRVTEATVAEPAGQGFDEAAVAAARRFEFEPARQGGRAVAARIRYRYRFTLQAAEQQPPSQRDAGAPQPRQQGAAAEPARGARLEGVVRGAGDRPVPGAVVRAAGPAGVAQATTDARGRFAMDAPPLGALEVTVSAAGHRPFRATEQVAAGDALRVVYRLAPERPARPARADGEDPDEPGVTVRSQRPPREVTRTTLDRREITRIPGTGGDALRAIQNLPGLARAPFLGGALIVRGAAPSDTRVFVDGTGLPLLYHFGGLASVIQTEMLDRIDFYPGNFSARFGRAMGGAVDVGLRSPRRRGYRGVANLNLIDVSAFVEGAITPELSFAVGARRSHIDVVLNAVLSNVEGVSLTAAPVYYDYQAVLEWRPAPAHRVRFALLGNDDTFTILFRQPSDMAPTFAGRVSLATRFHIAQLLWTYDVAPGTQSRAMLSAGWTSVDLAAGELFGLDLQVVPINLRYELAHTISRRARINVGFDAVSSPVSVRFSAVRLNPNEPGQDLATAPRIASDVAGVVHQPAMYVEAELTPVDRLRVVPGIRLDYFDSIRQAQVSPRMSFRWDFLRGWAIKGGVGLFNQPPEFQQSTGATNAFSAGMPLGNPNLLPQRAVHYGLGVEHAFSPWITLTVDGFYKTLDDLVVQTSAAAQRSQPALPPYTNAAVGRIYGAEVLLRHRATDRLFGWVAYTLLRSERRDGPAEPWRLFDQDQTHILTAVASYNFGAGFEAGVRFRYVTGNPATPVTGAIYNADSLQYTPLYGARNSTRLADFHQLDVRIDKTWRMSFGQIGVFLEVLNVYNRGNQEGTQYNYNYTQSQPVTGLPIFPNLGIRGEF